MFRSNDLAFMFAAFGVTVQFGGSSASGILDQPTVLRLEHGFGGIETDQLMLKLPFNAFTPMPGSQDNLVVDGAEYSVMSRVADGDAAIVTYALKGPIS